MRGRIPVVTVVVVLVLGMLISVDMGFEVLDRAEGATIYVDDDYTVEDPTHKKTIQAALDAAGYSDTVYVYSGNYMEYLDVDDNINLVGENKATTIIEDEHDPNRNNWKIFLGTSSSLKDFTIHYYGGYAVYMKGGSSLLSCDVKWDGPISMFAEPYAIRVNSNCIIDENFIDGYIDGSGSSISIINNYINERVELSSSSGKIEGNYLYALFLSYCSNLEIKNNDINTHPYPSNHDPQYHVSLSIMNSNRISIIGNNLFYCIDRGIFARDSSGLISENNIKVYSGIGIQIEKSNFNITYVSLDCQPYSGGIYAYSSHINIMNSDILITGDFYSAFGIYAADSTGQISNNNIKVFFGIGIVIRNSKFNILYTTLDCQGQIGGIYIDNSQVNIINSSILINGNNIDNFGITVKSSILNIINSTLVNAKIEVTGCHPIILNSVFDKSNVNIYSGSLTVQWYLHVFVTDKNNTPIKNANVNIKDNENGTFSQNYPTGQDGFIRFIAMTEYIEYKNKYRIFNTPHIITAWTNELIGFSSPDPFISKSQTVQIILKPGKFFIHLQEGWNLISFPLIQTGNNLISLLKNLEGEYSAVQFYNANDSKDNWKCYHVSKPQYLNDLIELNHNMGFWIYITKRNGTALYLSGTEPTIPQKVSLYAGWNLVGYPSTSNRIRNSALNNLEFGKDIDTVWTFDAPLQKWIELKESDYFELGKGYWVHAKQDCEWLVFSPILNLNKNRYYSTIQNAIDDANSYDTIKISPGIYNEELIISKPITILGENNQTCIIKGNTKPTIDITAENVTISYLNLSKGPYGVYVSDSRDVQIQNNVIKDHKFGIYAVNSSLDILNNQLSNNPQRTGGGGIKLLNCKDTMIEGNIIKDIVYGLYLLSSSFVFIQNNWIFPTDGFNDRFDSIGIALYLFSNSTVINNVVQGADVGIGIEYESFPYIKGNKISDSKYYGILIKNLGSPTLDYNIIENSGIYGIFSDHGKDAIITNNTLINNDIQLCNSTITYLGLVMGVTSTINTSISNYQIIGGELTVQWFLHVKVTFLGRGLSNATIEVLDNVNGTFNGTYVTNSYGDVQSILVTEFWQDSTQKIFFTPHNVSAYKDLFIGYIEPEIKVNSTRALEIVLVHPGE